MGNLPLLHSTWRSLANQSMHGVLSEENVVSTLLSVENSTDLAKATLDGGSTTVPARLKSSEQLSVALVEAEPDQVRERSS